MELQNYTRLDFTHGLQLVNQQQYFDALLYFLTVVNEETDILAIDLLIAYENIGFCQLKLKKYTEAEKFFNLMGDISLLSRHQYYLGELNWVQEKYQDALKNYLNAYDIEQKNVSMKLVREKNDSYLTQVIITRLMYCYYYTEQFDESEVYARKFLDLKINKSEGLNMLGNIYSARLQFQEAINYYKEVLESDKKYAMAHQNIANAHYLMRNFSKAEYHHKKLLKDANHNSPTNFNLAQIYLAQEDYKKGWEYFESRFVNTLPKKMKDELDRMLKTTRMWDGKTSLKNKSLLIISEQGFGDSIQFSRFIPLIPKDNTRIVFSVQPGLERTFEQIKGVDKIITADVGSSPSPVSVKSDEKFDYCVILMSLPYLLEINSKDKIPNKPSLRVLNSDKKLWKEKLKDDGFNVGLIFAGERSMFFNKWLIDKRRSMKVSDFAREFEIPGINWYNLTYAKGRLDLQEQISNSMLIDLMPEINDFYDTACLMTNMDLIVGVDTSAIHLSGSLGVETIMFNRFDSCWRWGSKGDTTIWYPNMTVLRQKEFLDWQPCLDTLHEILLDKIR